MNIKKITLFFTLTVTIFTLQSFMQPEADRLKDIEAPGIIQFIGNAGSDNVFTVKKWEILNFEMTDNNIENIKASFKLYTKSISTDWKKLESSVKKKKDYFFVQKFPAATVEISGATPVEDSYTTEAKVTLKGITQKVLLTFTVDGNIIKGEGNIQRRLFNFTGDGPKDEVPVTFEIQMPTTD